MSSQTKQMRISVLFLGAMIVSMTAAQIMFKFAGSYAAGQPELLSYVVSNPWLWAGLLASSVGMACWLMTSRNMPLAIAYPWTAMIYVLTPLCSILVFQDLLSNQYFVGMGFIIFGVIITSSSASG